MKVLNHRNLLRVYSLYDYVQNHNLTKKEKISLSNQLLDAFEYLNYVKSKGFNIPL